TAFGPAITDAEANAVAVQPDGKIVVAFKRDVDPESSFALMRLNLDGSLDMTFSVGIVVVDVGSRQSQALAVALQPDGKVVAGGLGEYDDRAQFVVVRVNRDGSPDSSFDGDGVAIADFGPDHTAAAFSVALQRDGKILASGTVLAPDGFEAALARFNSDGA